MRANLAYSVTHGNWAALAMRLWPSSGLLLSKLRDEVGGYMPTSKAIHLSSPIYDKEGLTAVGKWSMDLNVCIN